MGIELSEDTALVLFDRLGRWEGTGYPNGVDSPAKWALTELYGALEEKLAEPFMTDYQERVTSAEGGLMEKYGEPEAADIQAVVVDAIHDLLSHDAELCTGLRRRASP